MKWMPFRSPPTAHVAPLISADRAGELAALHATAFARPWEADEFERMLCERGHLAHALMLGTVIGGFVLSRQVLDEAEILTIVLGPASRGAGLSRQLLRAHLVALEDAGVRRVHLEVDDGNAPALALYHRHRFAETGRRASYYARPDGSRANAIMMQAALG